MNLDSKDLRRLLKAGSFSGEEVLRLRDERDTARYLVVAAEQELAAFWETLPELDRKQAMARWRRKRGEIDSA